MLTSIRDRAWPLDMEIAYNIQISAFYDTKPCSLYRILFSIASINIYFCAWLAAQRCANICSITVNLSCYLSSTPPCPWHVPQSLAYLTARQWNSLETFPFPNIHRSNTNNLWNPRLEPLANYKGSLRFFISPSAISTSSNQFSRNEQTVSKAAIQPHLQMEQKQQQKSPCNISLKAFPWETQFKIYSA